MNVLKSTFAAHSSNPGTARTDWCGRKSKIRGFMQGLLGVATPAMRNRQARASVQAPQIRVATHFALLSDGRACWTENSNGTLQLWSIKTGQELRVSDIVTGHYSPTEILMTLVIGAACLFGIVVSFRWRTTLRPLAVVATTVLSAILQIVSFRVSLLPNIANQ